MKYDKFRFMPQPRKTVRLSDSVHRQLNMYAFAATAAGVGALALAQPAEAKIVYTPANVNITNGLLLDLNNDGVADFVFQAGYTSTTTQGYCPCSYDNIKPAHSGNLIWGRTIQTSNFGGSFEVASALRAGVTIRPSKKLQASHTFMCARSGFGRQYGGPWFEAGSRYLGLMFYVKGHAHYGWARANFSDCKSGTLTGYAYETVPNKSIKTGKTKGPDVITAERGTLGHLARGASAIPARRGTGSVTASH